LEVVAQESGKTKVELKKFYQDQVELVVKEKVQELQKELDAAKLNYYEELKTREMAIAKSAASHIQKLNEK